MSLERDSITRIVSVSKVLRCPRAIGVPERAKSDVVLVNTGPELLNGSEETMHFRILRILVVGWSLTTS